MRNEEEHIEFIEEKEPARAKDSQSQGSGILRGLIDGTFLTRKSVMRQMPFILFLVFLSLLYISNRYHAEMLKREISSLRDETGELRSKAIFISSELMKVSRQTEVADEVEKKGLNLKESQVPPKKIVVKK
jgi:cell division protein FtsL